MVADIYVLVGERDGWRHGIVLLFYLCAARGGGGGEGRSEQGLWLFGLVMMVRSKGGSTCPVAYMQQAMDD